MNKTYGFMHIALAMFLLSGLLLAVPLTHADSCRSSDENRLDDEYDDAKDEFDDAVEDEDIEDKLDEVRTELRRADGRSSSAVERELDNLDDSIDDLKETGDELYEEFRDLADGSRYEDCSEEVRTLAKRLRSYIRGEIRDFEDEIDDLRDRNDGSSGPRRSQIRAPKWPESGSAAQRTKKPRAGTPRTDSSADSGETNTDARAENPAGERTVADIQADIRRVFNQLRQLIAELRRAQRGTAG